MKGFYFDLLAPRRGALWLRAGVLLLGVVALAAVLAYAQWRLYPELEAERARLQREAASLGAPTTSARMKPAELAQAWQRAHAVSVQLGLPWARFFAALARASDSEGGGVAFVSIEPEPLKGQVVLIAEARDLPGMLNFVSALQASPYFVDVALQSHSINKTVPEQPVRFRLTAGWRTAP
jgi:hypothetical protein